MKKQLGFSCIQNIANFEAFCSRNLLFLNTYGFELIFFADRRFVFVLFLKMKFIWKLGLKKLFLFRFLLSKNKTWQVLNKQTIFFNPSHQCYQKNLQFVRIQKINVTYNFFTTFFPHRLLNSLGSLFKQIFRTF